jgi:hypothetical protein
MALFAILRDTGVTILRAPLLWFFSAIVLITNVPSQWLGGSALLGCLSLLLLPAAVLAQAGQIKSVQLYHVGTPTSASQIIRHGADRMGSLIALLVVSWVLYFLLAGVLWLVMKLLFPQITRPDLIYLLFIIVTAIVYPITTFAQCAIVLADLPLFSSLSMVFRALKKDAFTVIALVAVFGLLHYFIAVSFPITVANPLRIAGYLVASLIMDVISAAAFTFAYLYCIGEAHQEAKLANPIA